MTAGRPTVYSEELVKKAQEYIESAKLAKQNAKESNKKVTPPNIADLSIHLGISRKTLYNLGEEHDEFLHILEQVMALQEDMLLDYGLLGEYNSTITKLMLTKHGYSDKTETDITSKGEGIQPVLVEFISKKPDENNTDTTGV